MGGNASTIYENPPTKNDQPHLGRRKMGGNASTIYENSPTKNDQSMRKGQVIAFHSSSSWKIHFETSKQTSKLIVIDFTASWCGPCQFIQPAINEFAEIYKNVDFIKIDVDELNDVSNEFEVQAMPTFILMKRGKEVDKVVGAQRDDLRKKIEKHMF